MKIKNILSGIIGAAIAVSACTATIFAENFSFNMEKARPTYGGGHAFSMYTRLDNERRDKYNFNPLWITEESTIEVEYTTGEYTEIPIRLVFQSWEGELVESKEDKWVQIAPTSFDDTKAVWNYETIINTYGSDFSDVYCLVLSDGGDNSLTVSSMTATNLAIPEEDMYTVKNGVILDENGMIVTMAASETNILTDMSAMIDAEKTAISETTAVLNETNVENENTDNSQTTIVSNNEPTVEDETAEKSDSNFLLLAIILSSVAIVVLIIVLIILRVKAKRKNWH